MKNNTVITLVIVLFTFSLSAQNLTCLDFKTGQFYIPNTEEISNYTITSSDGVSTFKHQTDSTTKQHIVIREELTQVEWKNGIGKGNPTYEIIEWIDDCTYRLTYNTQKLRLNKSQKWINQNNGIIVFTTKIENNCLFYTATMTTKNGENISQNGTICKKD